MGQDHNEKPAASGDNRQWQDTDAASPTTQQMRTVGQRRREAERKLDQHLEEAKQKAEAPDPDDQKTES